MVKRESSKLNQGDALSDFALQTIGPSVCQALSDSKYDTKMKGAKEIEEIVRFFQTKGIGIAKEVASPRCVDKLKDLRKQT